MLLKPYLLTAAALGAGLIAATAAVAITSSVHVTSATAAPGGEATVALVANVPGEPGVGAWTIDIQYDNTALSILGCEPHPTGVCNATFSDNLARFTGASASGLVGEVTLGTATFECIAKGVSSLEPIISVFGSAVGPPEAIDITVSSGEVTCVEEPTPTSTAAATAKPVATATAPAPTLPDTGGGPAGGDAIGWLVIALAAAGLAVIAGFAALRAAGGR